MVATIRRKKSSLKVSGVTRYRRRKLVGMVAGRVRLRMEAIARRTGCDPDMNGFCLRSSILLLNELRKRGVPAKLVSGSYLGEAHAWVEVGRTIVDVTATQFDGPPVLVSGDRTGYVPGKYDDDVFDEAKMWPPEQRPKRSDRLT